MSGHRTWAKTRRQGHAALERGFGTAIDASTWLPTLRERAGLTQEQLAERLGVTGSWVSQVEGDTDVRLSTLSAYVAALGGQLRLCATLSDGHDIDLAQAPQEEKAARVG